MGIVVGSIRVVVAECGFSINKSESGICGASQRRDGCQGFAKFTAQYIDDLGSTDNLLILRKDSLDNDVNLAQSEWMDREKNH